MLGVLPTGQDSGSHSFSICCVCLRGVWRAACERGGDHCSHRPAKCSFLCPFQTFRACFPCICINEVWVTRKITTRDSNQQFQIKFFSIKRKYLRKHCLMPKALVTHQATAKNHLKAKIAKKYYARTVNRLHIGLLCRYANSSMSTQQTKLRITEDKMINKQFFPVNCLKSTTTSLFRAKNIRFSCFRRDNETFTCRFASVQSDYKQRDSTTFQAKLKQ